MADTHITETATTETSITVYSTTWCPDCHRTKAFLSSKQVNYTEVDIEQAPEAADIVAQHNNGKHVVPTLEIGGQFYGNPSLRDLKSLIAN